MSSKMEELLNEFTTFLRVVKRRASRTAHFYGKDVLEFNLFLRARNLSLLQVTAAEVDQFLQARTREMAPQTVQRKHAALNAFYGYCVGQQRMGKNPVRPISIGPVVQTPPTVLSTEEMEKLIRAVPVVRPKRQPISERDRAILSVLCGTGVKVAELAALDVNQVNLYSNEPTLTIRHIDRPERRIPLLRLAAQHLADYLAVRLSLIIHPISDEEPTALFISQYGHRLDVKQIRRIIADYGSRAELGPEVNPSTLRDSFAVAHLRGGADLKDLRRVMGYRRNQSVKIRYGQYQPSQPVS